MTAVKDQKPVSSYRDLAVRSRAMDPAEACYATTGGFPDTEIYGITAQIRKAVVSISAGIAEGNGHENTGDDIRFLRIWQGLPKELETHSILSRWIGFLGAKEHSKVLGQCKVVG